MENITKFEKVSISQYNQDLEKNNFKELNSYEDIIFTDDKGVNYKGLLTTDVEAFFYNEGYMTSAIQIGNPDDSVAVANTQAYLKKRNWSNLKDEVKQQRLFEAHLADSTLNIVCSVPRKTPVKDILFTDRKDFCVDSLAFIPFSGKDTVIMKTVLSETQGVKLPLFEARMPYKSLLRGLDEQLVVNEIAKRKDLELYAGLKVGDVEKANNNAGNWE